MTKETYCIAISKDKFGRIQGYMLENKQIYEEKDLTMLINTNKIKVKNLAIIGDGMLNVLDTEEYPVEPDKLELEFNGEHNVVKKSTVQFKLSDNSVLRFINKEVLEKYKNNEDIKLEVKTDEQLEKWLNKVILVYGEVKEVNIDNKIIYYIKISEDYTMIYIPNTVTYLKSKEINNFLRAFTGTVKILGCEGLKSTYGWFSGITQIKYLDMTKAKLENIETMKDMFFGAEIKEIKLGSIISKESINLEHMFTASTIDRLDISKLDTTNRYVNINGIFQASKIKYIDASKLSLEYTVENLDMLDDPCVSLPFNLANIANRSKANELTVNTGIKLTCKHLIKYYNRSLERTATKAKFNNNEV